MRALVLGVVGADEEGDASREGGVDEEGDDSTLLTISPGASTATILPHYIIKRARLEKLICQKFWV